MSGFPGDYARNAHRAVRRALADKGIGGLAEAYQATVPVVVSPEPDLCRSNYHTDTRRREEPGDRIVRCGLPAGHQGDHDEMIDGEPGNSWPQRYHQITGTPGAYSWDCLTCGAHGDDPLSGYAHRGVKVKVMDFGPHPTGMFDVQLVTPIPGNLTAEQAEAFRTGWATAYQAGRRAESDHLKTQKADRTTVLRIDDRVAVATLALLETIPRERHGQLCPVWTGRRRGVVLSACDCWWAGRMRGYAVIVLALADDFAARAGGGVADG